MHIYLGQIYPPLINNRSLEHSYTEYILHMEECTYTQDRCTPLQLTIDILNSTTQNKIYQNAHIPRTDIPVLQLSTDLWNTTTPNKFYI